MPVLLVIHPDNEELSKVNHILSGSDFTIHCFNNSDEALEQSVVKPPDACLVAIEVLGDGIESDFLSSLKKLNSECPVILLINKSEISRAFAKVSISEIFDYFLLHPIVDPARLHVIINKALTLSAVQYNLLGIKQRLSTLPDTIPGSLDKSSVHLSNQIANVLDQFKERMKSTEFSQIVQLLDETALDDKFDELSQNEINVAIDNSFKSAKTEIKSTLTNVAKNLSAELDKKFSADSLDDLKMQLDQGFYFDSSELLTDVKTSTSEQRKESGKENTAITFDLTQHQILLMEDIETPSSNLSRMLEKEGFQVVSVDSQAKAMHHALAQKSFCLIIEMDESSQAGMELIYRIRNDNKLEEMPILAFLQSPQIAKEVKEAGVENVLLAPYNIEEMMKQLVSLLKTQTALVA